MINCPTCDKSRKRLVYHHDPPKSVIANFGGIPDGFEENNRRLCNTCHLKADREWGLRRPKIPLIRKRRSRWDGRKYRQTNKY